MVWKKDYPVVEGLIKGWRTNNEKNNSIVMLLNNSGRKFEVGKKIQGQKLKRHSSTHWAKQTWKWIGPLDIYPHLCFEKMHEYIIGVSGREWETERHSWMQKRLFNITCTKWRR